jgi:predicted membrane protein
MKGLIAEVAAAIFARKVDSVPPGVLFGLAVSFVLAFLVAYMQHDHYFAIIIPGSIVGLLVGYATQKYGAVPAAVR